MKSSIFYMLFFLIGAKAFSQTVISGKVTQGKGESLPGAIAYLQGTYDGSSVNGTHNSDLTPRNLYTIRLWFRRQ